MPSGAKKRKAAKKKQGSISYSAPPPPSPTHSQSGDDDLKHRDGRDSDGRQVEKLEKREGSSSVRSFVSEGQSNQHKSTGSSSSSNSSSSSSSSDDESHVVEKKIVVVEDSPATVDLVEPLESFSVKITQVVDDMVKPIDSLSEEVLKVNESTLTGEADNLEVETPLVEKVSLLEQVARVLENVSIENGSSSLVTESFSKENGMKNLSSLDKNAGMSSVLMDFESKSEDEDKRTSLESVQYSGPPSDTKVLVVEESNANPSNGGCDVEESEISQYSDTQSLVASAPRIVQTTSWKSCCGIFELFTGSNK